MIDPTVLKGEWTSGEAAKLGRMKLRSLRHWLMKEKLRRGQDPERQSGEWRRLNFADLLHVITVGYLVRYGVSPEEASRVVSKYIDPTVRRVVKSPDDADMHARLTDMTLAVRIRDDGLVEAAAFTSSERHLGNEITKSDHSCVLRLGAIVAELHEIIMSAATEASQGRA